jgi:16S rRNA (guanine(966)-N(2))-methyltransferase RsmD
LREALFSIWQESVRDAQFLDLFAGSGAVGLEALSRGAREAVFVEASNRSLAALRQNISALMPGSCRVLRRRLPVAVAELAGFDLIFADPPYAFSDFEALLSSAQSWLNPGGELVLEHSSRNQPGECVGSWRRNDLRTYGESCLSFYRLE